VCLRRVWILCSDWGVPVPESALVDGLWSLTKQQGPLSIEDVERELHIDINRYRDQPGFLHWDHVLTFDGAQENHSATTHPVNSVYLGFAPVSASSEQELRVTLDKQSCISEHAFEELSGLHQTMMYFPGTDGASGNDLPIFAVQSGGTRTILLLPSNCPTGSFWMRRTYRKNP
jgi:hypothetical protein